MSEYPIPTLKHFREATDVCVKAYDVETNEEVKVRLASVASLFAQLAEHLERGNSMTREITTRCSQAISSIDDDCVRRKIAVLLSDESVDP